MVSTTANDVAKPGRSWPVPSHERHFYAANRAFGRFGMRIFEPVIMPQPHWHGHIEANFAINLTMEYNIDGQVIRVPANRLVIFWAGIPHQLTVVDEAGEGPHKLCNIYLPLDAFLMMHHITKIQMALFGGAMIVMPEALCSSEQVRRWYDDYRSGDFERAELVKMELNALFRRASSEQLAYLRAPGQEISGTRALSSAHIRHVIAMVRFILENLEKPLRNSDIAKVTGLHENYCLSIFTRVMQVPLKQFVIRLRLMRARALLVESSMAISSVAEASGFSSVSQFYAHFRQAYGIAPAAVRTQYMRMELR